MRLEVNLKKERRGAKFGQNNLIVDVKYFRFNKERERELRI